MYIKQKYVRHLFPILQELLCSVPRCLLSVVRRKGHITRKHKLPLLIWNVCWRQIQYVYFSKIKQKFYCMSTWDVFVLFSIGYQLKKDLHITVFVFTRCPNFLKLRFVHTLLCMDVCSSRVELI